ncbi:hypothetical protein PQ478_08370 [Alkalihalophilus pseudofirmus]|uniref:hypothetical protein n=1 Tax=Alkalihalophilus pseudofirmus TaxID=79885 RepID=UPI00259B1408|nr:hypothetical protein [Alkalihalophilus pseudofirmus]WEG18483.1 hypothetical protein PQ478_08370 [Alkalihalophilus pseudofirmus]
MPLIDLDFHGTSFFESQTGQIRNTYSLKADNAIFDEIHITEDMSTENDQTKDQWGLETRLLARFLGNLEAGNVQNEGIVIEKFAIKRRKIDDLLDTTLSTEPFDNDKQFEYIDYTQANDRFIYSIVPVGENELEGQPNSVEIESDFVGWWVVDKDTKETVGFDKTIDSSDDISMTLNQGREQIETMSQYPSIFYTNQNYHSMQLQAVFLPEEWNRTGRQYESFIHNFAMNPKPFIIKGSSGEIFVADLHSPQKSSPKNTWKGRDYYTLTIEAVEVNDYDDYMRNG